MQRLLVLLAFLSCSILVKADCSANGIYSWPNTTAVKSNPVFVLTFYLFSQQIVPGLNKQHAVYLQSATQKVPLLITEICKGQFNLTQVILRPARQLTAGMEYLLVIDSLPKYEGISKWNKEIRKAEAPKWKVLKEADTGFPQWTSMPKYESKSYTRFGCGPSLSVVFGFAATDESDILIKTTVRNIKTGEYSTYYVESTDKTRIGVGHGMCAGAFDLKANDEYEVNFSLMDASGNPGCMASDPIRFTGPAEKDKSE